MSSFITTFFQTGHQFIRLALGIHETPAYILRPSLFSNSLKSRRMGREVWGTRGRKCSTTNKWPVLKMHRFMYLLCDILAPSNQQCISSLFPHRRRVILSPLVTGQRNGNTLICVAYVLMAWAGTGRERETTSWTPHHLVPPECRVTGEDGEIKRRRPAWPVNQFSYCKNNELHRRLGRWEVEMGGQRGVTAVRILLAHCFTQLSLDFRVCCYDCFVSFSS